MNEISVAQLKTALDIYDEEKGLLRSMFYDQHDIKKLRRFYKKFDPQAPYRLLSHHELFDLAEIILFAIVNEGHASKNAFDYLLQLIDQSFLDAMRLIFLQHISPQKFYHEYDRATSSAEFYDSVKAELCPATVEVEEADLSPAIAPHKIYAKFSNGVITLFSKSASERQEGQPAIMLEKKMSNKSI